jgi:hypothetical protein
MKMLNSKSARLTALIISSCVVLFSAAISLRQPFYDTDMLFYSAIYYENYSSDSTVLHRQVYDKVWSPLDSASRRFLNEKPLELRAKQSPDFFIQQLPFYRIKPGYNVLIRFLTDNFFQNPLMAMQWINVVAYVLTCIIIMLWLYPYLPAFYLLIAVCGICCSTLFIGVSRMFTPDMLSVFFLMLSFYLIARQSEWLHLAYLSLLISIFFRPENALMLILIAIINAVHSKSQIRLQFIYVLLSLIIYWGIGAYYEGYGWKIFFQHSAIDLSVSPASWKDVPLTLRDYIYTVIKGALTFKMMVLFIIFSSALLFAITTRDKMFQTTSFQSLIAANLLINPLRFLVLPIIDDRYYLSFYLLVLIVMSLHVLRMKNYCNDSSNSLTHA